MKIILHFIGIISSFTQQTIRSGTDLYLSPISDVSRYSASPGGTRRSGAGNEVAPVQKLPATERDIQNFRYREIILQGKATTASLLAQQIAQAQPHDMRPSVETIAKIYSANASPHIGAVGASILA